MLSRRQIILIQRARREARLADEEYRDSIAAVSGHEDCRSSTDSRLGDEHFDRLLRLWEAYVWPAREAGQLPPPPPRNAVFSAPGYWATRNPKAGINSRDRHVRRTLGLRMADLERRMARAGYGPEYLEGIRSRTGTGRPYLAAMCRLLDRAGG